MRIDFFGDEVESIRYFDVETQLSEQLIDKVVIVPDLSESTDKNDNVGLTEFIGKETTWWMKNSLLIHDRINSLKELDAGEFLDVVRMPFEEALQKVLHGEIKDSKTQVALLKYAQLRAKV